jgi:hypothetical protein
VLGIGRSCQKNSMRTLTRYICRFLLILIFLSAVSLGNAAAQSGGRVVVIRVANFGWNLAVNLKIKYRVAPADLDHCERAARRHLHFHRPLGFGLCFSPANDIVARGDGEIRALRSAI